jgi:hypothetical protein
MSPVIIDRALVKGFWMIENEYGFDDKKKKNCIWNTKT